jgi:predicted nucleic acid-binding protein
MKLSNSGRFVVLETLRIDRQVLERLASWAAQHGLHVQDAIQVAVCAFNEGNHHRPAISREGSGPIRPTP